MAASGEFSCPSPGNSQWPLTPRPAPEVSQPIQRNRGVRNSPIAGIGDVLQDVGIADEGFPVAHHDAGATPELSASHAERERVIEVLGAADGDGRLTMAELEKRVEGAMTPRTSGELVQLTADLPEVSGSPQKRKKSSGSIIRVGVTHGAVGG